MKASALKQALCLWVFILVASELPRHAVTTLLVAQEEKPESKTVSFADATDAPAEPAAAIGGRRRFLDRDARRLGITLASTRAALKDLKSAGVIDGTESSSELSVLVADHIASKAENKAAYKAGAPDWDAIFAFIEKLISFIMKFFAI